MGPQNLLTTAILVMAATTPHIEAKTVLMLPCPMASYINYHANIASALTCLGHEVWICVPHYLLEENLVRDKAVHVLAYGESLGDIATLVYENTNLLQNFWSGKDDYAQSFMYTLKLSSDLQAICIDILSEEAFVEALQNLKADLFVMENNPVSISMLVLPYKLDIPFAMIGTFHDVILSRVPFTSATTPFLGMPMSDIMSFSERLLVAFYVFVTTFFEPFCDSSVVSRFAPDKPYVSLTNLAARAEIFITELDHILDYPRPMLPNTKLTGGSSASPAKPLTGDFKRFVEDSKHGVIVASFGGSVNDVPSDITSKLVSAFKQLDLRVVWRINVTSPDPNHIMATRWIPQNDLLGHNKTKLFVSHCGKNGQYEALYHGVPILCLPIFADQPYNAERVRVKQLGLSADMRSASADDLADLMKQLVYESKYSENMKRASRLFRELYKVPMKEVAFWLDHVMTYGGGYMRSAGQEIPLYQYLMVDVIGFIFGVIVFIAVVAWCLVMRCCRYCRFRTAASKSKQE